MASSQVLLVNAFPRSIRDERPLGPCHLKRIGRPENEGLGNYDLMDKGNGVVIIKREVVSRKGPNSWLNQSLKILVRGPADMST